jgi:hypothetical protein
MSIEHSRALLLARRAGNRDETTLLERITATEVQVSAVEGREDVLNTAMIVIDTLRRLPVQLTLRAGDFADAHGALLAERARAVDPVRGLEITADRADLRIHLGMGPADVHIVGMPERHGGHVGGPGSAFGDTRPASGLGVMTTAALVCGEAFKAIADVSPGRAVTHERFSWCPVTLSDNPGGTPPLRAAGDIDLAIVGLGAIGTAITAILSMLPLRGTVMLVDPERFAPENVGTYSVGGAQDAQTMPFKTDLAADTLRRFRCVRYPVSVEELVAEIDSGRAPWPALVLTGTDSADARREAQRLWPERLIDGATGDTTCGLHDVAADTRHACLQCIFAPDISGPSSAERLARATGLPADLLRHGDELLTEQHVDALAVERQELLRPQVGRPVCGLAQAVGLTVLPSEDYRPSVPFVSQQAACLVVGRLVASILGVSTSGNFVQYDALIGPHARVEEVRLPSPECFCQQRADIVQAVRGARAANPLV